MIQCTTTYHSQSDAFEPEVSSTLKDPASPGRLWLESMKEEHALVSGITGITHPALYQQGIASMTAMQSISAVAEVLPLWQNPFNVLSVISNRGSPAHRDFLSAKEWYDFLITLGGDVDQTLQLDSLGLEFSYQSGTGLFFSGGLLTHSTALSAKERLCLAYYM